MCLFELSSQTSKLEHDSHILFELIHFQFIKSGIITDDSSELDMKISKRAFD